jgi:hypothetical protein
VVCTVLIQTGLDASPFGPTIQISASHVDLILAACMRLLRFCGMPDGRLTPAEVLLGLHVPTEPTMLCHSARSRLEALTTRFLWCGGIDNELFMNTELEGLAIALVLHLQLLAALATAAAVLVSHDIPLPVGRGYAQSGHRRPQQPSRPVDVVLQLRSVRGAFVDATSFTAAEFDQLVFEFRPALSAMHRGGHLVDDRNLVALVLIYLRSYPKIRGLAAQFGVSKSTISKELRRVLPVFVRHFTDEIAWPCQAARAALRGTFPHVPAAFAAIDTTTHKAQRTLAAGDASLSYSGHTKQFQTKTQIVSTAGGMILHLQPGFRGSLHDARIFRESALHSVRPPPRPLASVLISVRRGWGGGGGGQPAMLGADDFLIGDHAYAAFSKVFATFSEDEQFSDAIREYSAGLAFDRSVIEHVIAHVKGRSFLAAIRFRSPQRIFHSWAMLACAIVHNRRKRLDF